MDENSVVISGMSGRFPGCDNTKELQQALVDGIDLVSDNHGRWPKQFYGLSDRAGVMKHIDHFDANFFGLSPRQADGWDPRTRILQETVFEAILDAGVHPKDIRGTRTGVFLGMTAGTGNDSVFENRLNYSRLGRSTAVSASSVAFAFDLRGPSYAVDTACSSSLYAFCQAAQAIRSGECDAAFVGGASIILDPCDSLEYKNMGILSPSGKCQFLDENRDGFVKSESVSVVFLQKAKDAKRVYATVVGSGTNTDGFKFVGVTNPSIEMQRTLLEDVYTKFNINPDDISYFEAHGTGTKVGDIHETTAIAEFLCKDRKKPLLIGSVKTNLGHTETASGITSIIKVLLSMHYGTIPPILHLNQPGEDIPALMNGKIKPVTQAEPWKGGLAAVNCFGLGGTNAHVVLAPYTKTRNSKAKVAKPRLIQVAGRTEQAVNVMFKFIQDYSDNIEVLGLIDNIFHRHIQKYLYRGYTILNDAPMKHNIKKIDKDEKQVWFVYSGIGSQWPKMGANLMKLDLFKNSMSICANAVKPHGIDLIDLVVNGTQESFNDVINCFTAITAMSICLTDVLVTLGITPDGIIGHSVGEISCAYADELISREQTMQIAYARGNAIKNSIQVKGALAVVGLTVEDLNKCLPADLSIACYNCSDNLTISGPYTIIESFVNQLKSEAVFAEMIEGGKIAYHSKYILEAGENYFKLLQKILVDPKPRSEKWISSSIPRENWETDLAKLNSPEYHRNNLINPVLFQSALESVPKNAVVIEISPKGLLQTILKRNLGNEVINISLSSAVMADNLEYFFAAVGKLYLSGLNPNLLQMNDNANVFPVSAGTPSIAPLIDWDHSTTCDVEYYSPDKAFGENIVVDIRNSNMKYLEGHHVEGKLIYPVVGYIESVWKVFAKLKKKPMSEVPVVLSSIKIRRMTLLPINDSVVFNVNILKNTGKFEVCEGGSIVAEGFIKDAENVQNLFTEIPDEMLEFNQEYLNLTQEDCYNIFNRVSLEYTGDFRTILESDARGLKGKLKWSDIWVTFFDALLQYCILSTSTKLNYICLPESMDKIIIDPQTHLELARVCNDELIIKYDEYSKIIRCGGVQLSGLQLIQLPERKVYVNPKLEHYKFLEYTHQETEDNVYGFLSICFQIALENTKNKSLFKILQFVEEKTTEENVDEIMKDNNHETVKQNENKIVNDKQNSSKDSKINLITDSNGSEMENQLSVNNDVPTKPTFDDILKRVLKEEIFINNEHSVQTVSKPDLKTNHNIIILSIDQKNVIEKLQEQSRAFVISISSTENEELWVKHNFVVINKFESDVGHLMLLKQKIEIPPEPVVINITTTDFSWVNTLKIEMKSSYETNSLIYLVSQNESFCGLVGLVNCLLFEEGGHCVRAIQTLDKDVENFSLTSPFYKKQLEKDLVMNIFKGSSWGSFRFFNNQKLKEIKTSKAHIHVFTFGDFSQLKLIEDSPHYENLENRTLVYYAGMNFKDVLIASGVLRVPGVDIDYFQVGYEFSGRKSDGTRVMGINMGKSFATEVFPRLVWKVPDQWTLEEAATVPLAYITTGLALKMEMTTNMETSILIHGGSGAVGIAAIQLSIKLGFKVFTTVSTEEKKEFLVKQFPELNVDYIGNSRNCTFETMVLRHTKGRGVNIVLNSLTGDLFEASMRCVAVGGRFIEIGRVELVLNTHIKSTMLLKSTTFQAISLDDIFEYFSPEEIKSISAFFQQYIDNGFIVPIPQRTVYKLDDIQNAFKYYSTTKHTGKIVIKIRDEESYKFGSPSSISVRAIQRVHLDPEKTFVIVGGLGGLGLELADWLCQHGARKIVLNSRSGLTTGYQSFQIKNLKSKTVVNCYNTINFDNAKKLIMEANKLGPVGGIFNLALVIEDDLLENQTIQKFENVYGPKVKITQNMDTLSRKLCPDLDYFVCYSSVSCGKGNIGQTNYGFANSCTERICELRNEQNLPGMVIQWGPVSDVGYFSRTNVKLEFGSSLVAQSPTSYARVLDDFLLKNQGIVSSVLYRDISLSIDKQDSLVESVMKLFGITDQNQLDDSTTLIELGMDSLMGYEIKQYLAREHEVDISVKDLRNMTIKEMKRVDLSRQEHNK